MSDVSSIKASSCCPWCHVKAVFCLFPPFRLGCINIRKPNMGRFSTQYSLSCLPNDYVSLFLLPNFSNPHTPTLELKNPSRLDPDSPVLTMSMVLLHCSHIMQVQNLSRGFAVLGKLRKPMAQAALRLMAILPLQPPVLELHEPLCRINSS